MEGALKLGVSHASLNLNLCSLIQPEYQSDSIPFWKGNVRFQFNREYVNELDQQISQLSKCGALVYLVTLAYRSENTEINEIFLHPDASDNPPNSLCAINTKTTNGVLWFQAAMEFVAERWSRPDQEYGRVVGYIIGNELTSHWWWYNMGRVDLDTFATDYLRTLRLAHSSVRRRATWPRLFLSIDHHWGIRYPPADSREAFGGRDFIDCFSAKARLCGDFDWSVAFHAYPENLYDPRFWLDESAYDSALTPRITPKNLRVLTNYFERSELLFGGKRRHIILSEQGFHTTDDAKGELIQAIAFCRAYQNVVATAGIDAFILHRQTDRPNDEGGLRLGLCDSFGKQKLIYECFRLADTNEGASHFAEIERLFEESGY